jgi:copper chaperone for superoxide dismutase
VSDLGSAVCILETHSTSVHDKVRGLVRMVQVAPSLTIMDLSIRGLSPGQYHASIRQAGDISQGPESTGGIWEAIEGKGEKIQARGVLGTLDVSKSGIASVFLDKPIEVWELIGRSIVVSKLQEGKFKKEDPDTLVGVIARSAGVWDNDKTVCSCSGKTVWEERKEQVDKGML